MEYEVIGDGAPYRVEVRRADPYYRSIFNGTEDEWQRDVVATLGLLRRVHNLCDAIPQPVVDAFNGWRTAEHARQMKALEQAGCGRPDGGWLTQPPAPVRGGRYVSGTGWVVTS